MSVRLRLSVLQRPWFRVVEKRFCLRMAWKRISYKAVWLRR